MTLGNSEGDNTSASYAGDLYLLLWKRLKRGKTEPLYPLRPGPLIKRHDGGLAAVVERWTLYHWQPNQLNANANFWRDSANSEEDIRSLSSGLGGIFLGTDSGVAAIVHLDGGTLGLKRERTSDGSYDSRDGVLATATDRAGNLAATGTLQGQIKLYNPQPAINAPASVTEAHAREITAMSMTADGQMLVSASGDGELKFWRVHNERLELFLR